MTHGIKAAGTRPGLDQGKGEPGVQWQVKRQRTCKEMPKVTRCTTGADEVVVAQIPMRGESNVSSSEGLYKLKIHRWVHFPISRIAVLLNPKIRGWINYYSKFRKSELRKLFRTVNLRLTKWVRNKYRKFRRRHWYIAYKLLKGISRDYPNLFEHWKFGFLP